MKVVTRQQLESCRQWAQTLTAHRKDYRYFEILEDTLPENFEYRYFALVDAKEEIRFIFPFFITQQDIFQGVSPPRLVVLLRRLWPTLLTLRTLMVGSTAGEGHLSSPAHETAVFTELLIGQAKALRASLVVFKEFPASYRPALDRARTLGFIRIPSMPMTRLNIEYADFDHYAHSALNSATRKKLKKKFAVTKDMQIEMSVVDDIAPHINDIYPLYLQVYDRSRLRFEKLSKSYFCQLSERMSDKVRFFTWRRGSEIIAFSMCMIEGDSIYSEYVGFSYPQALTLHLYHYIVRDMLNWSIRHRFKWFRSTAMNYDPKLHLRHELEPLDLYIRHRWRLGNLGLKLFGRFLSPVRSDPVLPKFRNFRDLW